MTNKKPEKSKGAKARHGLGWRLRRYFLAGILVTAPIGITIYLTWEFLAFVDYRVGQLLPEGGYDALYGGATIPGLGLLMAVVFFVLTGWLTTNFIGRIIGRVSEYFVTRLPVISSVYKSIKQVFETIIGTQAQAFREVVLFEYPRAGSWSLGFVTAPVDEEVQGKVKGELVSVFVPTAPSPVNGFLLFVPRADLIPLKMTVDEGIKMIVSVGLITPSGTRAIA